MRTLLAARTVMRAEKFRQPRRLLFHIRCTQPKEKLHLLFSILQTKLEVLLTISGSGKIKTKRTSKSQQVFHMCSVNQGMSGFGGRSCRDNQWKKSLNYLAHCPLLSYVTFSQELFFFSFHIVCLLGPFCTFPIKFVCFVSLRASSAGRSGGVAGKGRRACNHASGI